MKNESKYGMGVVVQSVGGGQSMCPVRICERCWHNYFKRVGRHSCIDVAVGKEGYRNISGSTFDRECFCSNCAKCEKLVGC